jgi:hypothetical protein
VTTTASITKLFYRTLPLTQITATGSLFSTTIIPALNVIRGFTKFLFGRKVTRGLDGTRTTKPLTGLTSVTRRAKDD